MVDGGLDLSHLEEATEVGHQPGHERGALIGQYLRRYAYPATEQEELLGDGLGGGFAEGNRFRVASGIIHDDEDVLVAQGGLWQRPYQIHPYSLEGYLYYGQRNEWAGGRSLGRSSLARGAGLAEALHLSL